MKRYGLIGERLGHSHSQTLHGLLADYDYRLYPMPPEDLDAFLTRGEWSGLNVTIPYKQAVIPYVDELSATARAIGSVNTLARRADGTIFGDNTDAYGMSVLAARAGFDFAGRKALVLGSGGTSRTACHVVREAGGVPVVISRRGENNYDNLEAHADAAYLINTTPVGMYPNVDAQAVDLTRLTNLRGVLDVVYNPLRTQLMRQAQALGIPCAGGLRMLVYQAVRACELFTGEPVTEARARAAEEALRRSVTNLVLVGMPGCGKSTIGRLLAHSLNLPLIDIDAEIAREAGMSIPDIFRREGEAGFRRREREQITRFASVGGRVLVTGGGAVKDAANREHLRMNGFVAQLTRELDALPMDGRPLSSNREAVAALWRERKPLYEACADAIIPNDTTPGACAARVKEAFDEALRS